MTVIANGRKTWRY